MKRTDPVSPQLLTQVPRTQFGALCWRERSGAVEILLITSRDTGRWVVPKGWPMDDRLPHDAALQEAWEEAGVKGTASSECAGFFSYAKTADGTSSTEGALPCIVAVYPVAVAKLARKFPERAERRRKWFTISKAVRKVDEPELQVLLEAVGPLLGKSKAAKAGK